MKITIDEDICLKNQLSFPEVIAILLVKCAIPDIPTLLEDMKKKGILISADETKPEEILVTARWNDVADTILLDSDQAQQPIDRLEKLVIDLQNCFPEGKKDGTAQYWRGNKRDILLRLKKFFKLYGNAYTDEQILTAAKTYVHGFNGSHSYMRVLKYFIWKDERRATEDGLVKVVEVSDLANYIENANTKLTVPDNWAQILT